MGKRYALRDKIRNNLGLFLAVVGELVLLSCSSPEQHRIEMIHNYRILSDKAMKVNNWDSVYYYNRKIDSLTVN